MKPSELKVNQLYLVKLTSVATVCKLLEIKQVKMGRTVTHYVVRNLKTNRTCTVKTPAKFIRLANINNVATPLLNVSGTLTQRFSNTQPNVINRPKSISSALAELAEEVTAYKAPHLIVLARAGTGKTTTMEEGIKYLRGVKTKIVPSEQQKAIWKVLEIDKEHCNTIGFCAFNRSIAEELKKRVGKLGCDAMTIHSLGRTTVYSVYPGLRQPDDNRTFRIIQEITGVDVQTLREKKPELLSGLKKLVSIAKMNLVGYSKELNGLLPIEDKRWEEDLWQLMDYYEIDCDKYNTEAVKLAPKILHRALEVVKDGYIDFDDMVWLPVVAGMTPYRYDMLIVDEAQDLNPCQQELVLKAGERIVIVGDDMQAIYGFTGADSESIPNMYRKLSSRGECVQLKLTVTRRCGKAIVNHAKKYVPDFEAHESNPEGNIDTTKLVYMKEEPGTEVNNYMDVVKERDMVLCRTNAPLVSQCFRFIAQERKAIIRGRDIATGLLNLVDKMKAISVEDLVSKLETYFQKERDKENAKKFPNENRLMSLDDRELCMNQFIKGAGTVQDVKSKIDRVFNDKETEAIVFSSVHKAKGLEADNVFLLLPKDSPMPHPMAKTSWAKQQEINLIYVAITRAKFNFYEVRSNQESENEETQSTYSKPTSKNSVSSSSQRTKNFVRRNDRYKGSSEESYDGER